MRDSFRFTTADGRVATAERSAEHALQTTDCRPFVGALLGAQPEIVRVQGRAPHMVAGLMGHHPGNTGDGEATVPGEATIEANMLVAVEQEGLRVAGR